MDVVLSNSGATPSDDPLGFGSVLNLWWMKI